MRLVYVNSLFPTAGDQRAFGGAETFALRLVRGLQESGHEVTVVRSGTDDTAAVERTADGIAVHSLPKRNLYPFSDGHAHNIASRIAWHAIEDRGRVSPAFGRILDEVRPDMVHTNNVAGLTTDVWRVAREAGVPILHTLHDYYLTCPKVLRFAQGHPCGTTCTSCTLLSRQRRRAVRNIDRVVGVSERMLAIHRAEGLFVDTPSEVILNKPPPRWTATPNLPRPLGPRPVFGYIGRLAQEKGIYELLEAFVTLEPGAARLVIAGAPKSSVRDWVALHVPCPDDITFTGFTTHDAFYPIIDVAVIPSVWEEPCSMGAGEAFSFGVPAIGSRRGGIPEMLEGGRFGWLFEPGTGELARLLARLVADPAIIAAKAETVRGGIVDDTRDLLVTSYLAAYEGLMRHRASPGDRAVHHP